MFYFLKKLNKKLKILVTGAAGFIGSSLCLKLIEKGQYVIGIDNINDYYDINLKKARLKNIEKLSSLNKNSWQFFSIALENTSKLNELFDNFKFDLVVNLAAQAGVRYSLTNPSAYISSNLVGFANILEAIRKNKIKNLIYASSSSVYGLSKKIPFSENDCVSHPISLYAATKSSNELMAHSYSHLYGIKSIGLRFFTVYGPWGRPDMAPMIFAKSIFERKPIDVFNFGEMERDFTFIDDVVESIYRCCLKPANNDLSFDMQASKPATSFAPHMILNVGNKNPINLNYFIEILEKEIGIKAIKNFKQMQPGDVVKTYADTDLLEKWINFKPITTFENGIKKFVNWYRNYYID